MPPEKSDRSNEFDIRNPWTDEIVTIPHNFNTLYSKIVFMNRRTRQCVGFLG